MLSTASSAEWLVAAGTVGALFLAVWQIRQNGKLARQENAIQMWMEYVRLGLANPELGEDHIAIKYLKVRTAEHLVSGETLASQRYLWFLTVMLDACEHLFLHVRSERWIITIEQNVGYHCKTLALVWPDEARHYSKNFGELVMRVLERQAVA